MFEHLSSILKSRFRIFETFSTGVYRCSPVVTSETKLAAGECLHRWPLVVFGGVPVNAILLYPGSALRCHEASMKRHAFNFELSQ